MYKYFENGITNKDTSIINKEQYFFYYKKKQLKYNSSFKYLITSRSELKTSSHLGMNKKVGFKVNCYD